MMSEKVRARGKMSGKWKCIFYFFIEFSLSWKLRCERERNEESSTVQ
jgi:hypothetical protein